MPNQRHLIVHSIFFNLYLFRVYICTHTQGRATSLPHGGDFASSVHWNSLTFEGAKSRKSSRQHKLCQNSVLSATEDFKLPTQSQGVSEMSPPHTSKTAAHPWGERERKWGKGVVTDKANVQHTLCFPFVLFAAP